MDKSKSTFKTVDLVYIALGAVLIAICSCISIPTLVPLTMQTFAVFCVLSVLGGKRGTMAVIVYLIIGAAGVPVFAEFTSGIAIVLGTTGGYMVGFIFIGLIYGLAVRLFGKKLWVEIVSLSVGMAGCYAFGTAWLMFVYARASEAVGLMTALGWCVFPFIIPDLIKLGLALLVSRRVSPMIEKQNRN